MTKRNANHNYIMLCVVSFFVLLRCQTGPMYMRFHFFPTNTFSYFLQLQTVSIQIIHTHLHRIYCCLNHYYCYWLSNERENSWKKLYNVIGRLFLWRIRALFKLPLTFYANFSMWIIMNIYLRLPTLKRSKLLRCIKWIFKLPVSVTFINNFFFYFYLNGQFRINNFSTMELLWTRWIKTWHIRIATI